eukprot:5309426-Pyramimonas_sp.AAC.1
MCASAWAASRKSLHCALCKPRGASDVVQDVWCMQAVWCRICGARFVARVVCCTTCGASCAVEGAGDAVQAMRCKL